MSDIIISFVVPCYNVSKYIEQCIKSIEESCLNLTYEIITVEDFSTDDTYFKLIDLSKYNQFIKIIKNCKNEGLGNSRNIGFSNAIGKYVWFVDSDDWIDSSMTSLLVSEMIENDLDVLSFNLVKVKGLSSEVIKPFNLNTSVVKGYNFIKQNLNTIWFNGSSCNKLYSRSFLLSNNIVFPSLAFLEDNLFSFKVKYFADRFKHINVSAYFYRFNQESLTNSAITNKKKIETLKLCRYFVDFIFENKILDKEIEKSVISYVDFYLSSTFKPFLLFSSTEMNESVVIYFSLKNYFIKFSKVNILYKLIYKNKILLIIYWFLLNDFYKLFKRK